MKAAFGLGSAPRLPAGQPPAATFPSLPLRVGAAEQGAAEGPSLSLKDAVALYAREPSDTNARRVELAIAAVRRGRAPSRPRALRRDAS